MEINQDSVPATIKQAVNTIVGSISEEDKEFILQEDDHASIHHTVGMYLRNAWSLWEPDSPLKRDAVNTYKIAHADDITGLIFTWAWKLVRGETFDPQEHCEIYHKHWAQYGQTSLEAGGWNELD